MTLTAEQVLTRTIEAYASCTSYRDRGEVTTVMIRGEQPFQRSTSRKPFRTAFVRPDRLRFEFRNATVGPESEWSRYVVWASGGGARCWWTTQPVVRESPTILEALSGPTGISSGSAIRIPRLLFGAAADRPGLSLGPDTRVDGDESVDGFTCIVLRDAQEVAAVVTLWLDRESFLIRRVASEHLFDRVHHERMRASLASDPRITDAMRAKMPSLEHREDFRTETTATYVPELNPVLPDAEFEFTPPYVAPG